jgi:uncharacterized protein (TIGR04222 family)
MGAIGSTPSESEGLAASQRIELREQLTRFDFDDSGSRLEFSERLARENGWNLRFARRVVEEYKRFLELAVVAGHVVTPSDTVDQAWHQHLVYTRSYWDELCGEVLRQPLHHGPTRGGVSERSRYEDLYERTLQSYRAVFGASPPLDIWPPSKERFRQSIQSIRVDRGRNWVIPKPSWLQVASVGGATTVPFAVIAAIPLQMTGTTFLLIYTVLSMAALLLGLIWRWRMLREDEMAAHVPQLGEVGWAATAMMMGGSSRALLAIVTRLRTDQRIDLVSNRLVVVDRNPLRENQTGLYELNPETFTPSGRASNSMGDSKGDAMVLEEAVRLIGAKTEGIKLSHLANAMRSELNRLTLVLEKLDLWISSGDRMSKGIATTSPLVLVMLCGLARCAIGISREKPIGFLVGLIALTAVGIVFLAASFPRRTRRGALYAKHFEVQHPRPHGREKYGIESKDPSLAPYMVAAYGAAMLEAMAVGEDLYFYQALRKQSNAISDGGAGPLTGGDGGGCGGGAGCGGGCGGCGGCGG